MQWTHLPEKWFLSPRLACSASSAGPIDYHPHPQGDGDDDDDDHDDGEDGVQDCNDASRS